MNNYNMSDSGINVNVNVGYDYDLSQINFDQSMELLEDNFCLYVDYGNLSNKIYATDLFNVDMSKENVKALIKIISKDLDVFQYDNLTKEDIYEKTDWMNELIYCIFEYDTEIKTLSQMRDIETIERYLNDNLIPYTKNFELLNVTGYSQGDFCTIIVNTKEFHEVLGTKFDSNVYKQSFEQLLYNTPISATCDINDLTYYCEMYDQTYETFDKDLFLRNIMEQVIEDKVKIDLSVLYRELENCTTEEPIS